MRKVIYSFVTLILIFIFGSLTAQTLFTNYKRYTVEDGLVSNTAFSLLQDNKGYLWIGTIEGVSRFDGKSFTNYGWDDNCLPSKNIYQIIQFNDSLILFATSSGIAVFNMITNRFENETIKDHELKAGSNVAVVSFAKLPHKRLILTCTSYLVLLDEHLNVIKKKKFKDDSFVPTFTNQPIFMDADSTEILLHGTSFGRTLNKVNTGNLAISAPGSIFKKQINYNPNGYLSVRKISEEKGAVFCVFGDGFTYINPYTKDSINFYFNKASGEPNSVRSRILPDPLEDSILWIGSGSGLIRFNYLKKTYTRFLFTPEGKEFYSNFIHDIIFDKDGNLWVATLNGIIKIGRLARSFHQFDYDESKILQPYDFENVCVDSKKRMWAPVFGRGIFEWDKDGNFIKRYEKLELPMWNTLHEVKEIDGTVYAATGRGLEKYNELNKKFVPVEFYPDSLSTNGANVVYSDSHQQFWVGVGGRRGIFKYDPISKKSILYSSKNSVHNPNYIPMQTASSVAEDKNGNLWFGLSREGGQFLMYDRKTGKFIRKKIRANGQELNTCEMNSLIVDEYNNIWISTWYFGVLKYNINTGAWAQYDRSNGLPGNYITSIVFDADGNLWANNFNGISVLLKNHIRFRGITRSEGFPYTDVSFIDFPFKDDKNKMVLGCNDKLIWVDRKELLRSPVSCKIYLEKLIVENKQYSLYDKNEFTARQSHFTFHFAGVNLMNGEQNLYAYMLEGVDNDWIYCAGQKDANYANISPGNYKFKAKVSIANDKWSAPVEYAFCISPPYWNTWWFRMFLVLTIASAIYMLYRIRIKRIIEMERIRSRISRDLHDDIGSTLSSINMLSHSAKKRMDENDTHKTYESLEKINDRTQRMLDNMNDIIWSIKPGNDSLPSVLARMREYAGTILEAKNIDCKIDFPPENTSLQLPLEFKNNVFLIFKEAINNLAKYSGATQATIKLSVTNHKFYMSITDNGKGFKNDGTVTGNGGNGLLNMKRRADELKAEFIISSKIGEGTTIEFIKKLH